MCLDAGEAQDLLLEGLRSGDGDQTSEIGQIGRGVRCFLETISVFFGEAPSCRGIVWEYYDVSKNT